jgi:small subunit ribosomal protein S8
MSLQSTDQIADLITRIRNAIAVGKTEIRVPTSRLKLAVATELMKAGYVAAVAEEDSKPRNILHISINEAGKNAAITEIKKVSTPGRRIYVSADEIPRVKSGRGTVLISTSKGILNGREAKKQRLGGELMIQVY